MGLCIRTNISSLNALRRLSETSKKLTSKRTELRAKQSHLSSTIDNSLSIAEENMSPSQGCNRGVDFARETAKYTQNSILQQGGAFALSRVNAIPDLALTLLR